MADESAEEKAAREAKEAADAAKESQSDDDGDDDDDDDLEDGEDDEGLGKVDKIVKNLIETRGGTYRKGSPEADTVRKLVHDTFKLRSKNARLRERVVGKGDVIVKKGSETDLLAFVRQLKMSPTALKTRLEQADGFEKKIKVHEREKTFSDVADGLGYTGQGKKAFLRAAEKEGIDIQMKEVEIEDDDGKMKKAMRPFAKLATESDTKLRPIIEYVEQELGDYLPAFQAEGSDDLDADDSSAERRHTQEKRKGVPMVKQSGSPPRNVDGKKKANAVGATYIAGTYGHAAAKKS